MVDLEIAHHAAMQMQNQLMMHLQIFALLIASYLVKIIMKKIEIVLCVITPVKHVRIAKIIIALFALMA